MSTVSMSNSTLSALQTQLALADTNADGNVSKSELAAAVKKDAALTKTLVDYADNDGDGEMSQVEYSSFANSFSSATGLSLLSAQETPAKLFAKADSNGSATVSAKELSAALTASDETAISSPGEGFTPIAPASKQRTSVSSEVKAALDKVDSTGDGTFNANDVAAGVLQASNAAALANQQTGIFKSTKSMDVNGDGTVSATEAAMAILF